jgi:hypothetical protein
MKELEKALELSFMSKLWAVQPNIILNGARSFSQLAIWPTTQNDLFYLTQTNLHLTLSSFHPPSLQSIGVF